MTDDFDETVKEEKMSVSKFNRAGTISGLPSVLEVYTQLTKLGRAVYLDHTIRINSVKDDDDSYIIEGEDIKYCEFRNMGLTLILIYLQRMLLGG